MFNYMQKKTCRQHADMLRSSKVKLLYDSGHHFYLHWVIMDSICRQGLHQGQIPSEEEEQVNGNSATYTSSLSTVGGVQQTEWDLSYSHCEATVICSDKLIDLFQGCDRRRESPLISSRAQIIRA